MPRPPAPHPPEASPTAHRVAARVWRPLERFLHVEATSGLVLLATALVALLWANSPWSATYEHLWHTPVTIGIGAFVTREPLHFWINDGLMAIFFFVVGLEIRREIHEGELSDPKRAALPLAAALGGMIVPALIYLSVNQGYASRGWGVPTATDIAFAVGVLVLLGKRIPPAIRVLLLALAIIDDIGAIVIIALFYSTGVSLLGLAIAGGGALLILVLQRLAVRRSLVYMVPAALIWFGMLRAGIHPTIAGVIVGMLTPVKSWFGREGFVSAAQSAIDDAGQQERDLLEPLRRMKQAQREAVSPVERHQSTLHPWVAYGIMPLFALANAGVNIRDVAIADATSARLMLGIVLGLGLGKPLGIGLASFVSVRLGVCALPRGVGWAGILLVGIVAGIGFTMAIFIAGLAFANPATLGAAKLAVLVGSLLAAACGVLFGKVMLPAQPPAGSALTLEEAETSTEK